MKFKTKPDAVHKMLGELAEDLPDTALAFHTLVSANPEGRAKLADKIYEMESAADERYVKLIRKVAGTFITPYDREDLYDMIEAVDDVIDWLDHAAYLVVDFKMGVFPQEFLDSATELVGMSEQARDAVQFIKKQSKLGCQRTRTHHAYPRELLVPGANPIEAIKIKILADIVEQVATQLDSFTRTIAVAAIKEA